jgi:hypothetical protein
MNDWQEELEIKSGLLDICCKKPNNLLDCSVHFVICCKGFDQLFLWCKPLLVSCSIMILLKFYLNEASGWNEKVVL